MSAKDSDSSLESVLPDCSAKPDETLLNSERAESVRRAVAELPDELRTPLILAEYEGLSHAEIARIIRCSAKAVESRIYRARQQLRAKILTTFGVPT
jgi:RNA polymerase sigma-70 factor (ECF subfamily)